MCDCVCIIIYRKLGESRVVDSASKRILLELKQLDDQTRQGFTGGGVVLDILRADRGKDIS